MEKIFSCNLNVNGENVEYHVVFENEKYVFTADNNNASISSFSFAREDNEWIDQEKIDPAVKKEALSALDKYLLSQH